MRTFAYISDSLPTRAQIGLAEEQGIRLLTVSHPDPFTVTREIVDARRLDGAIVSHPVAALALAPHCLVGVYQTANTAPPGEPPVRDAISLYVYDLRVDPQDD
jgi:hypothetical protein